MPILYSVIAIRTTVIVRYAACEGNFTQVTDQILPKIAPHDDKLTYSHGQYLFHYITEKGIVYFCITDDQFQRTNAFKFLGEIKERFTAAYGNISDSAVSDSMYSEFVPLLKRWMHHYNESRDLDKISRVHGELDELKHIMVKNVDSLAERGERLELLVDKTENLATNSVSFRSRSEILRRSLFWKNIKLYVIMAVVLIIVLYFVVSMFCGGLAWKSCVSK